VHALTGAVGYRLEFAGLSFSFSGDACASWGLVHANEGGVDLLITSAFPPRRARGPLRASRSSGPRSRQRGSHLADPRGQGVQPRQAARGGAVAHAAFAPVIHDQRGTQSRLRRPLVQTQDVREAALVSQTLVMGTSCSSLRLGLGTTRGRP